MITLPEFYDKLSTHDWFYNYSDDHSTWRRGLDSEQLLLTIASESEQHKKLYYEYHDAMFSGKVFGTEKKPIPEKPKL